MGAGESPTFGARQLLFRVDNMRLDPVNVQFDVSPDDRRFLFLHARDRDEARVAITAVIVQNWLTDLRERLRRTH